MSQKGNLSPIGVKIDSVREKRGITLYRAAKNAGMDYSQFYRVMRGKSYPTRESLMRICRGLGCSVQEAAEIFRETDYRSPSAGELEEVSDKMIA